MIPLHEIIVHTHTCPETVVEKENNENSRQKRKRRIQMFSWTVTWILVCIPSNIMAMIFYLNPNNVLSRPMNVPTLYITSNTSHGTNNDGIQRIPWYYSTNATDQVWRKYA